MYHLPVFSEAESLKTTNIVESIAEKSPCAKDAISHYLQHLKTVPTRRFEHLTHVDALQEINVFMKDLSNVLQDFIKATPDDKMARETVGQLCQQLNFATTINQTEHQIMQDFLQQHHLSAPFVLKDDKLRFHPKITEHFDSFRQNHPQFTKIKEAIEKQIKDSGAALTVTGTAACQRILNAHSYLAALSKDNITFYNPGTFGLIADVTRKQYGENTIGKSKATYRFTLPIDANASLDQVIAMPPQRILSTKNSLPEQNHPETGLEPLGNISQVAETLKSAVSNIQLAPHLAQIIDKEKIDGQTLCLKAFVPQYDKAANCYAKAPLMYAEDILGTKLFTQFCKFVVSAGETNARTRKQFLAAIGGADLLPEQECVATHQRVQSQNSLIHKPQHPHKRAVLLNNKFES